MRFAFLLLLMLSAIAGAAEDLPVASRAQKAMRAQLVAQLEKDDAALQSSPGSVRLLSSRGDTHFFLGHFTQAVADYEKMIALDPSEDAPHWRLGIAYYFARQWEKASRQFAKYHAYDGHDRENGIWKFLADVQWHGLESARREMLVYTEFDREPFPALYELLAGKLTSAQFEARLVDQKLADDRQVMFFARYYGGLDEAVQGRPALALGKIRAAVALFQPEEASQNGPGFMWHAARLQYDVLKSAEKEK